MWPLVGYGDPLPVLFRTMFTTSQPKQWLLIVLAMTMLAAACSSDGGGDELIVDTTTTAAVPETTVADDTDDATTTTRAPATTTTFLDPVVGPGGAQEGEVVTTTTHAADGHTHGDEFVIPETDPEVIEEYVESLPEGAPVIPEAVTAPATTAQPTTTTTEPPSTTAPPEEEVVVDLPRLPERVGEAYELIPNRDDVIVANQAGSGGYIPSFPVALQIGSWTPLPESDREDENGYSIVVGFRLLPSLSASIGVDVHAVELCFVSPFDKRNARSAGVHANGMLFERYAVQDEDGRWRVEVRTVTGHSPGRGGHDPC